jgi:hypothetical protein
LHFVRRVQFNERQTNFLQQQDDSTCCEDEAVDRIRKVIAAPEDTPWMWTLAYGQHRDRSPTHGFEPTREAAMAAFA